MPTFGVSGQVTISIYKNIRAEDEQEALEIAESLSLPNLCHYCASAGQDDEETWELSGELDGSAVNLSVN